MIGLVFKDDTEWVVVSKRMQYPALVGRSHAEEKGGEYASFLKIFLLGRFLFSLTTQATMSQNQDSLSQATSKLSLNPNAASWKPNLGAKEFVPSFGAPAPAPAAPASSAQPGTLLITLHFLPTTSIDMSIINSCSSSCHEAHFQHYSFPAW